MIVDSAGLLVDTSFFFALFNERDQHHTSARGLKGWLDDLPIILPWPVLYETVNTRFSRQRGNLAQFRAIAELPSTVLLDDSPYRLESYGTVMMTTRTGSPISLVDTVLRAVLEDVNVPVGAMLTFNHADFADICARCNVELLESQDR